MRNLRNIELALRHASKRLDRDPADHPRTQEMRAFIADLFDRGHRDFELRERLG